MPSKLRSHVGHIAVFIVVGATAMTERFGAPRPLWGALRLILAATFAVPGLVALCLALRAAPATAAFPGQSGPIAFESTRDGNFEIYAMDADGENQTNLTNNAAGDFEPAFSPDGTKIAFTSLRDGNAEVYVMDANGQNQTNLTNNAATDLEPAFSPDGTKIAFTSDRDGNAEVYVMDANGQNQTNLTDNAGTDSEPAFSPDGTKIAFRSDRDGNAEVYAMDANGQNQTNLTDNAAVDLEPAFSPNGTKIAFMSDRDGNFEIYAMDANGQNPTRLTNNAASDLGPAFSPDGTKIAFMSDRDGNFEIYAMDANGQNPTNLTDNPAIELFPDWGVASNLAPTANAGADQTVDSKASVTLNGSGSSDPDGDQLTYTWSQTSGPSVTLSGAATATASFTAPVVSAQTTLGFRLEVCDPDGACDDDAVQVTVKPPMIDTVIDSVEALDLHHGTENALLQKLTSAQQDLDAGDTAGACQKLGAFINEVGAQRGKKIDSDDADALIAEAEAVRASLGCA